MKTPEGPRAKPEKPAFMLAPRRGAKTRDGTPCQAPAMPNGRCRMHGGPSTGPKTEEGRRRCAEARFVHGGYTKKSKELRATCRALLRMHSKILERLGGI
jgi:hypothetical protein